MQVHLTDIKVSAETDVTIDIHHCVFKILGKKTASRTDTRTDGRTDVKTVYPQQNKVRGGGGVGGINIVFLLK